LYIYCATFDICSTKQKSKSYESAYLATLFPSIVITRGHNIQDTKIFPLIVEKLIEYVHNISEFTNILKNIGGLNDLKKKKTFYQKKKC